MAHSTLWDWLWSRGSKLVLQEIPILESDHHAERTSTRITFPSLAYTPVFSFPALWARGRGVTGLDLAS